MDDNDKPKSFWDMLHQDEWWRNAQGEWVRIDEIDLNYAENLHAYLLRHAQRIGSQVSHWLFQESFRWAAIASDPILGPGGDMACDAFDSAMDELMREEIKAKLHYDSWILELEILEAIRRRRDQLRQKERDSKVLDAMVEAGGV